MNIFHYMKENKAKVVQGPKGLEAEEGTEQVEAAWIYKPHKFAETYIKKKNRLKGVGESEKVKRKRRKDKDVFLHTVDLKIRGRRHLMCIL